MIFARPQLRTRPATPSDRNVIMTLARFERRVHSHLDWKPVEAWLGAQPFLLAEQGQRVVGALACPPDPPDTAWVRLLALADNVSAEEVWRLLWEQGRSQLAAMRVTGVAGLSTGDWMPPLYQWAGFQRTHAVVVLARAAQHLEAQRRERGLLVSITPAPARLRLARPDDYAAVIATDQAAFTPPWHLSPDMIRTAIAQADLITVAEVDGQIVGYQLTTASRSGAHLARLAVDPPWQGHGIGAALVANMIEHYEARGVHELTVNTQDSNAASLNVYQRLGFQLTGRIKGTRRPSSTGKSIGGLPSKKGAEGGQDDSVCGSIGLLPVAYGGADLCPGGKDARSQGEAQPRSPLCYERHHA